MAIPKEITLEDIRAAAARLDAGEPHHFGPSTEYLATLNGMSYPPKALVGLAARRVLGRDLKPNEFSSGQGSNQAVGFLRQMGVDVFEISGEADGDLPLAADPSESLASMCLQMLRTFQHRPSALTKEAPQPRLVRQIGKRLELLARQLYPDAPWTGDGSVGKGNWARVPWAALFHTDITDSAQRGEYPVVHFHTEEPEGGESGVRVGFGISATGYGGQERRRAGRESVGRELVAKLGEDPLPGFWFVLSDDPQPPPAPRGHLDRAYSEGMVLQRFFTAEQLEHQPEEFEDNLRGLIHVYHTWAEMRAAPPSPAVRYWLFAPGEGAEIWAECQRLGIAAIGWDDLSTLSNYTDQKQIAEHLRLHGAKKSVPSNDARACWEFAHEIRPGDVLISKGGRRRLLGAGRVTSDYRHDPSRPRYHHVREVEWFSSKQVELPEDAKQLPVKSLTNITDDAILMEIVRKDYFEPRPGPIPKRLPLYTIEQALVGLFMPKEELAAMAAALRERKNVVLQGPPGVGKTFIARRLAWLCMGQQDSSRVQLVQFHQSYSYEDFVQGYRPNGTGFARRDGVFFRFCERARQDQARPHVFIIDEINRGNLSKIFGELLMLIEADKRGPGHAIELTYSEGGEAFFVPENVHILGLMNTADRSLAMVDYALRRRFRFFELRPRFDAPEFEEHLLEAGAEATLVASIRERLGTLNDRIASDGKNLGRGMQIGHSFFCASGQGELDHAWYCGVVRGEIAPLLEEYWFDRPERAKDWIAELLAGMTG